MDKFPLTDAAVSKSNGVAKGAFARLVGVTPARVSHLIGKGLPVLPNGRIDPEAGKRWIAQNIDPARQAAARSAPATAELTRARAEMAQKRTALLELKLAQQSGELVSRAEVGAAIVAHARHVRDAWIAFAASAAADLARELKTDPEATHHALDRAIRGHLAELAATPWNPTDKPR